MRHQQGFELVDRQQTSWKPRNIFKNILNTMFHGEQPTSSQHIQGFSGCHTSVTLTTVLRFYPVTNEFFETVCPQFLSVKAFSSNNFGNYG